MMVFGCALRANFQDRNCKSHRNGNYQTFLLWLSSWKLSGSFWIATFFLKICSIVDRWGPKKYFDICATNFTKRFKISNFKKLVIKICWRFYKIFSFTKNMINIISSPNKKTKWSTKTCLTVSLERSFRN